MRKKKPKYWKGMKFVYNDNEYMVDAIYGSSFWKSDLIYIKKKENNEWKSYRFIYYDKLKKILDKSKII